MKKKKPGKKPTKVLKPEDIEIKDYFFAFEVLKQYPYSRSYIIKAPMKKSLKDAVAELFVGRI